MVSINHCLFTVNYIFTPFYMEFNITIKTIPKIHLERNKDGINGLLKQCQELISI